MIDRKAFWISGALVALMLAAAFWRISLLPDWTQLPRFGMDGTMMSPVGSWVLFMMPGSVILVCLMMAVRGWLSKASGEERQPWKSWGSLFLAAISVIIALMQAFLITRSFGFAVALNPVNVSRGFMVLIGILTMVMANQVPKLPWLASRIGFLDLDSQSGARLLRVRGWMGVATGFAVVLGALFTPVALLLPVMWSITLLAMAAGLYIRFQAKRGPLR